MRKFGKLAKKFQTTKNKSSSAQKDSFSEADSEFFKSTTSAMDDDILEERDSQEEKKMEEEKEPNDLHEDNKAKRDSPTQKLCDFLDLKLLDIDDEETKNKCHALIAFHKFVISQCDDLKDQSAKYATVSGGIHIANNPLWIYLSSALTMKVEEITKWNPDLLEATVSSSSGDIMLPENKRSDDNKVTSTTVVVTNIHDTPSLNSVDNSAVKTFVDKVRNLQTKEFACRPDSWIVNKKHKKQLASQLKGAKIISNLEEFDAILLDTDLFVKTMDRYLVARGCSGDSSLVDKVTQYLRLSVRDVRDIEEVDDLSQKWFTFEDEHLDSSAGVDIQLPAITQFVEVNSRGSTTQAHKYLINKVRDFVTTTKPKTLSEVVLKYIDFIYSAKEHCDVAFSCGYRILDVNQHGKRHVEDTPDDAPLKKVKGNPQVPNSTAIISQGVRL